MSQLDSITKALFRDPVKRRAWVKYQVQLQGRSMAQLAADHGVKRATLYQTFQRPYPRMEAIIADAVGLTPQELWPERYDADGLPNRPNRRSHTKGRKRTSKNVQDSADESVSNRRAAGAF